ncbi:MAG TPA: hypothetical protein VF939_27310 [Puia sp.]
MKSAFPGLTLGLCLIVSVCPAQDRPSDLTGALHLPPQYFERVGKEAANLDSKMQAESEKYLARLSKTEQQLSRRLYRVDSVKAKALFGDAQKQYAALEQSLKCKLVSGNTILSNNYLSGLDSLKTGLDFLGRQPALLSSVTDNAALKAATSNLQQLQARFGQLSDIQEYGRQRMALLKEQLSRYGMGKQLLDMNKETYYYQQQLEQYKAAWKDPGKMQQVLLGVIRQLPAFQRFFQKNSYLAQLFPMPDNLGTPQALAGLQARADIQQVLQKVAAGAGPGTDPGQYVQQQVQAAQDGLNKLKSRVSELGGNSGSGDMVMPDFRPDHQKNKSFLQRLEYGFNFQTSGATALLPAISDIGLSIGYRLADNATIGTGLSYKLGLGRRIDHVSFSNQGIGIRGYLDIKAKGSFWVTGGFEYNYWQQFSQLSDIGSPSVWQKSALLGISKKYQIGKAKQGSIQLLYDFLANKAAGMQAFKFRVGWTF